MISQQKKAAKHRPLKPIEIANAKPRPVSNVPTEGSKEEMRQFGQKWLTKTTDVKAYRAMLEAEKDAAGEDWNESGKAFFWGLQEGES
jgi:hypothetical protein